MCSEDAGSNRSLTSHPPHDQASLRHGFLIWRIGVRRGLGQSWGQKAIVPEAALTHRPAGELTQGRLSQDN